jgi:hypothetical protein
MSVRLQRRHLTDLFLTESLWRWPQSRKDRRGCLNLGHRASRLARRAAMIKNLDNATVAQPVRCRLNGDSTPVSQRQRTVDAATSGQQYP